jgi:hypothetical protein
LHLVSRLPVELFPVILNVGLVDLLFPIVRFDFFETQQNGFFAVTQNLHDVLDDPAGKLRF